MKRFAAGLLALLLLGALPKGNAQAAAETPEVAATPRRARLRLRSRGRRMSLRG